MVACWAAAAPALAADGPLLPGVSIEIEGGVPRLKAMRKVYVTVRVTNGNTVPLPGCTAADYDRGKLCIFLGAWFAPSAPRDLGTFEHSTRLDEPIPPGYSAQVVLAIQSAGPEKGHLAFGLFRSSLDARNNAPVGQVTSVPVQIESGSWLDNHQGAFLRGLVLAHALGLALALGILYREARHP